jgi:hypothetical protein
MPKLLLHNGHMYLGNAKSGTTSVKSQFDLIKDDASLEIENSHNFTQQYVDSIRQHCRTLPKFVLFFHVREPWDRFLAAVATDIKRGYSSPMERCEEIKNKSRLIIPNQPDSIAASGLVLKFSPVLETVYKTILLTLPAMADKIETINLWNYNALKESIERHWNCKFDYYENLTPTWIKNTVYDFFEGDKEFKLEWMKKNIKDYELYELVKNKAVHSLSCREYINKFYEKL